MTINDLYLNVKDVSFDSIICQTQIKTEADKEAYLKQGYQIEMTEAGFRERFPMIVPERIYYSPSISLPCFYYNKETLAICAFHINMLALFDTDKKFLSGTLSVIEKCEEVATTGKYNSFTSALMTLPDRMRLEFFTLLLNKHGADYPGLYKQFFATYKMADYGFNGMDKTTLQTILKSKSEEDRLRTEATIKDLPTELIIYRGGNSASAPYKEAWSWTLDINVANFFAARRGTDTGYIAKAKIHKKDIVEAFLDSNSEKEIIVNPKDLHIIEVIPVHGISFLEEHLPKVAPIYRFYLDWLKKLDFAIESDVHGQYHSARVLLLTQFIAERKHLPYSEKRLLATAAIFHDTQRTHDGDDKEHGALAAEYYHRISARPEPIVEFLCKYHCLPDEAGYAEIATNPALQGCRALARRLIRILKDADALDRVRFCISNLDMNQLRESISEELTLVARICFEQIKF